MTKPGMARSSTGKPSVPKPSPPPRSTTAQLIKPASSEEADPDRLVRAERRLTAKMDKLKRDRAQRRNKAIMWTTVATVGVGAMIGLLFALGAFDREVVEAGTTLDPALSHKPQPTAGTGELTQLRITTLIEGAGPPVLPGHTVRINYVGVNYSSGEEFDSSWSSPTESRPFSFVIGRGTVIAGIEQGLQGVRVGSRVQADVPAHLAYGAEGYPERPATAGSLRFIIDVLESGFDLDPLGP